MIECNGTYVITHNHKHGNAIYRCTLANAKKLLDECLKSEAVDLGRLAETLKSETRPVRSVSWLTKALAEVRDLKEKPERLRTVLYGGRPREGEDTRPMPVISKEMQAELVLSFFSSQLKLEALDGRSPMTVDALTGGWGSLSFLAEARTRLGADVRFIEDYLYDGYQDLSVLLKDRWKETAKEENIVANHYVPFFNRWGSGRWSVEAVVDA